MQNAQNLSIQCLLVESRNMNLVAPSTNTVPPVSSKTEVHFARATHILRHIHAKWNDEKRDNVCHIEKELETMTEVESNALSTLSTVFQSEKGKKQLET